MSSASDPRETMPLPPDWRPEAPEDDALYAFLHQLGRGPLVTDAARPDPDARYLIGGQIGAGSASQVLDAYDRRLLRPVALKILHLDADMDRARLARFVAEAQVTAQLDHPAIPPVHDIGRLPGGMPYFTMRRVPGATLDARLAHLRVGDDVPALATPALRLELFLRVCDGVAHAHARGVVHRDLKPANLIVDDAGGVQIMDWGLAKIGGDAPRRRDSVATFAPASGPDPLDGAIAGTPAYMAPEQAWGDTDRVGPAADVYALGLMLAELLTLYRVRRHATRGAMLSAARTARAVDANRLAPGVAVPTGLAEEIRRATDPDPARRHADARELFDALARQRHTPGRPGKAGLAAALAAALAFGAGLALRGCFTGG